MTITELREISKGRFVVGFSDGSEMKANLDTVADLSLFKGRELSDEEFEQLSGAARLSACKERALKAVGLRPMSCRELFNKLVEKGEQPEDAEACVEWLTKLHYLDDVQYAAMVVRHYSAKGYGAGKIREELYRRGVAKSLWDEALSEMPEMGDKAYELLCRKLRSDEPDRKEMKTATDALYRHGYSWDEIKTAVSRFEAEHRYD